MRKLEEKHENQIDNMIYNYFVIPFTPILKKIGLTPNMITITSIILALIGIYFLTKKNTLIFSLLFAIAYILDCIDGYMARKYKMESKIGDLLDHGGDLFKFIVLFYILYKNFNITQHKLIIIIMLLLLGLHQLHIGCQEQHSKYETHLTLKIQKTACINKDLIKYTRFFGTGTIILYTIIISNYLASLKS